MVALRITPSEVKELVYVRTKLDEDRVLEYAALMEAGVKFPPIEVNQEHVLIDGRHRLEAVKLCKLPTIEYNVTQTTDEVDLISRAYKANAGGALPPSREDTEHTIRSLLERSIKADDVASRLNLPPSIARKYVAEIKSKIKRSKIVNAAKEVAEGKITVDDVAAKYGLKSKELGDFIAGNPIRKTTDFAGLKRGMSQSYISTGKKAGAGLRKAIAKFEDGDLSEKQVRALFKHLGSLQKKAMKAAEGWLKRFEALLETSKRAEKVEV